VVVLGGFAGGDGLGSIVGMRYLVTDCATATSVRLLRIVSSLSADSRVSMSIAWADRQIGSDASFFFFFFFFFA
jgi:hypothetical protein